MKTKVNKKAAQFDELSKKLHDLSIVIEVQLYVGRSQILSKRAASYHTLGQLGFQLVKDGPRLRPCERPA